MNTINLDDFLKENANLDRYIQQSTLDNLYTKYKSEKKISEKLFFQIYMKEHAKERFVERFQIGEQEIWVTDPRVAGAKRIKIKDLPGWRKLEWSDLDKILINGINELIRKFKFSDGAYLIVSKSTGLVLPAAVFTVENNLNKRAVTIDTILHNAMNNNMKYIHKSDEFDFEKVYVESKNSILKEHKNCVGSEDFFTHDELNVEIILEGSEAYFSRKLIFVE